MPRKMDNEARDVFAAAEAAGVLPPGDAEARHIRRRNLTSREHSRAKEVRNLRLQSEAEILFSGEEGSFPEPDGENF